jgi:plasmid maintenance system killer protein
LKSRATARFWELYAALPARVQRLARKNYQLWQDDESHPSLGFKRLKGGSEKRFSIRVGDHYRAIGQRLDDSIEWVWIGSHEDYNKF